MNLLEIEKLLQLMNNHGVTHFKSGDLSIICPKPKQSIKKALSTVTPEEIAQIEKQDQKSVQEALLKQQQRRQETEDEILFFHEQF